MGEPARLFYRSVPAEELPAYRRAVERAKGRILAAFITDRGIATLASALVRCGNANPQRAYDLPVAEYIWGQLADRWGAGSLAKK
jgi:hypothetical protein